MKQTCLLIIDDEQDMRNGLKRMLSRSIDNLEVLTAPDGETGLEVIADVPVDVILLDVKMPGMSGLEMLKQLSKTRPWLTTIMMTGYGSIETAVEAIKLGAYDFITKPFDKKDICRIIRKSIERKQLIQENYLLKQKVGALEGKSGFVGQSEAMRTFLGHIKTVARSNYTTLIRGRSGTGKELAARAVHNQSARSDKPLVMVNCPAIPEHLLESELFGHVKGAFTGADYDQRGLFAEADGGTICLDEVGDLPISVQSKLLRVLQEHEIKPLGATRTETVNVRVIASTNLDLEKMIKEKTFREDLFYRLNVVTLQTPSLHDIVDDIPLLVDHFCRQVCRELELGAKQFSQKAVAALMQRQWPGNVRELQNLVRRVVMFSQTETIDLDDLLVLDNQQRKCVEPTLGERRFLGDGPIAEYKQVKEEALDQFTNEYLTRLLKETEGNVSKGAEISGLSRTALQKIIRKYGISADDFRP